MKKEKNSLYWSCNLPLQVWPKHADPLDDKSEIVGCRVLNYMPRKERCEFLDLDDVLCDQTREEFFESAAKHLENLARLMREAATDTRKCIYYPDEGMD